MCMGAQHFIFENSTDIDPARAEAGISLGQLLLDAFKEAMDLAGQNSERWHEIQQGFTTSYVERAREAHPDKSVLVSCQPSDERLNGKIVDETVTVNVPFGKVDYRCYVFDDGEFWNRGEGSLINWCFSGPPGTWTRDGAFGEHVIFRGNPDPASLPPAVPIPPVIPKFEGLKAADGVYLVNSLRGEEKSSGLAYYKNMRAGGNDGQLPDDYVDLVHGDLIKWEGHHEGTCLT
jgi:hypothetical protein